MRAASSGAGARAPHPCALGAAEVGLRLTPCTAAKRSPILHQGAGQVTWAAYSVSASIAPYGFRGHAQARGPQRCGPVGRRSRRTIGSWPGSPAGRPWRPSACDIERLDPYSKPEAPATRGPSVIGLSPAQPRRKRAAELSGRRRHFEQLKDAWPHPLVVIALQHFRVIMHAWGVPNRSQ